MFERFKARKIKRDAQLIDYAVAEAIKSGGNFRYIAQNMATIYYCISEEESPFFKYRNVWKNESFIAEEADRRGVYIDTMRMILKMEKDIADTGLDTKKCIATALIDLFPYIQRGDVPIERLTEAGILAKINKIGNMFIPTAHAPILWAEENSFLKSIIMQTEFLIFKADVPYISEQEIKEQIIENKSSIIQMCDITLKEGKDSPLYSQICQYVKIHLSNEEFINLVSEIYKGIESFSY